MFYSEVWTRTPTSEHLQLSTGVDALNSKQQWIMIEMILDLTLEFAKSNVKTGKDAVDLVEQSESSCLPWNALKVTERVWYKMYLACVVPIVDFKNVIEGQEILHGELLVEMVDLGLADPSYYVLWAQNNLIAKPFDWEVINWRYSLAWKGMWRNVMGLAQNMLSAPVRAVVPLAGEWGSRWASR